MLNDQIIEFELRGLGPLVVYVIHAIYFYNWLYSTQNKRFQDKSFNELVFIAENISGSTVSCFRAPKLQHLSNLIRKFNILNVIYVLDL